jgi:hypothetical protein
MSDKIVVDLAKAVTTVRQLINEKPEGYRYQDNPFAGEGTCRNILWSPIMTFPDDMQPGCIVGSVVVKLGVKPVEIFTTNAVFSGVHALFSAFHDKFTITDSASRYLVLCQGLQDSGVSWADAHSIALNNLLHGEVHILSIADLEWLAAH